MRLRLPIAPARSSVRGVSDGHRPLHGSVHEDGACWVCGSRDYGITVLGDGLFDASDFVPPGVSRRAHWYDLCECRSCGHTWTATDHPSWLTTRAHEFIRYKEPTEHFPEIRALIEAHGIDVDAASIHTFSYKDQPLLDFLRPGTRPGPDIAGLTRDWEGDAATRRGRLAALRDELARSHAGHRIVLMRRILEHVASRTLLEEILGLVDDRTSLVFDMADFPALSRSTTDFVWNERRHYWTINDLQNVFELVHPEQRH